MGCLSWVRRESHAQFFGEGVVAISPPYPTTYAVHLWHGAAVQGVAGAAGFYAAV
jgi:hypothetical protein